MALPTGKEYIYFILKRKYIGFHHENLQEDIKKQGTIFFLNLEKDFHSLVSFMEYLKDGKTRTMILEDNNFCCNFETEYFSCLNLERAKKIYNCYLELSQQVFYPEEIKKKIFEIE